MPMSLRAELNPTLNEAPELRSLLEYWRSKCPPNGIPNRTDIVAAEIKPHLEHLFIAEPLPEEADFRYRLIGTALTQMNGKEFTGSTVRQLLWGLSTDDCEATINAYQIVVRKKVPLRGYGAAVWAGRENLMFDSIHMPIMSPDKNAVWLLGKFFATGWTHWPLIEPR